MAEHGSLESKKVVHHSECYYKWDESSVEDRCASCEGMGGDGRQN